MLKTCHGCGAEKDPAVKEAYGRPSDFFDEDELVGPTFGIDCEPTDEGKGWKVATVCIECLHRLGPDHWVGQRRWESIDPVTPFASLPNKN